MEVKLVHDGFSVYYLEINGVKLEQELHYQEANLIKDYLEANAELIREGILRK